MIRRHLISASEHHKEYRGKTAAGWAEHANNWNMVEELHYYAKPTHARLTQAGECILQWQRQARQAQRSLELLQEDKDENWLFRGIFQALSRYLSLNARNPSSDNSQQPAQPASHQLSAAGAPVREHVGNGFQRTPLRCTNRVRAGATPQPLGPNPGLQQQGQGLRLRSITN